LGRNNAVTQMRKVSLKDGREVILRFLKVEDKEKLFEMFSSMSDKALEWSLAPYSIEDIERWISSLPNRIALVAEYQDKIVGLASIYKIPSPRRQGVGELSVYLHQDFHSIGLGTAMTKRILKLAKNEKMHRIELAVVAENKSALCLYRKFDFQVEGISKDRYFGQDGKYYDIVNMGLILPSTLKPQGMRKS